jgi:single-strand DNA-binding protein
MSVNKVILLGRLGQEPELKNTPSGLAVCNFSIATSETWKDKNSGQKQERTEWHRIVVWGKLGELCQQYLHKGRQAYVEGRLQTRSWDDKNGVKRYTTEVLATTVQFVGANNETSASSGQQDHSFSRGAGSDFSDQNFSGGFSQDYQSSSFNNKNQNHNQGSGHNQNHSYQDLPPMPDMGFTADDVPF